VRWEKLEVTYGWKSRPVKAVAGRPGPSLAGPAVTLGLKRRQGSCGVRVVSLESQKMAEAELLPVNEGSMCAVAKREGAAPPGSWTASRTKGHFRNPGGPAGSIGLVADGGVAQGRTGALRRAEAGSRTGS
jgi:hypothetical protein